MKFHFGRKLGIILLGTAVVALAIPASAQETETPIPPGTAAHSLTVNGTGTAYAAPDIAYLELGVETVDAELSTAFSQTGETISAVLQALKDLDIAEADIQTSGINVYPQDQFDPQGNSTSQRVYHVSNTVQVTVRSVDQVEAVLTAAVGAGANTIYNLTFGIEDISALEQQARTLAVADVQRRAQQLADAFGVSLGRPITIAEIPQNAGQPIPIFGRGGAEALVSSASGQPVNQGQLSITIQIEITYSID